MRNFNYEIMDEIKERWSLKEFSKESLNRDDLLAMVEAARFAPSNLNSQPWLFFVPEEDEVDIVKDFLYEGYEWAENAPNLIVMVADTTKEWYQFDLGACWSFIALEGQRRGIFTNCIHDFDVDAFSKYVHLPKHLKPIAIIVAGKPNYKAIMDLNNDKPSKRNSLDKIVLHLDSFI